MQFTPNYELPLYEDNDITDWMSENGFNGAMTKIDTAIKAVDTDIKKANTDITGLEQQMANANDEINELTGEVSDLQTLTSGQTSQINNLTTQMNQQSIKITELENQVEALDTDIGSKYYGVLSSGETTLAITIGNFTQDSLVDIYAETYGIAPLTVELRAASGGQPNLCVTTWDAQAGDVRVGVYIH